MKRKIWIFGLIIMLLAVVAGCGKKKDTGNTGQAVSGKNHVYKVNALEFSGQSTSEYSSLIKNGDVIYAYGYDYGSGEDSSISIKFASLNADGSIKKEGKIVTDSNTSINSLRCDEEGNIYTIKNVYITETEEEGSYKDSYYLVKYNEEGEEMFSVLLNDLPQIKELASDNWFYAGDIVLMKDGVYVSGMGNYFQFDMDGNFVKILTAADGNSYESTTLYPLENGKVACLAYEEDGYYACYVDLDTGVFSKKTKLPGSSWEYSVYPGIGYDLYLVNSYGVFGYNVGDEDRTQLMDYVDSDLGIYSVYNVLPINEKEFWGTYDDMETYTTQIGRFTKVEPEDVKDKKTIVLACTGLDWNMRTNVVKFNKSNEEYRITIQDYSSLYDSDSDYMAGINRLNADIVSGKVPDILVASSDMPIDSYIAKGLFEDLKPYISNDKELDINNFMPNIIDAYSVDGKLYRLVPSYLISTILAKTSDVGEERGWTVQEVNELMASKPEGTQLLNYVDRNTMLINCMSMAGSQFIDRETGKCNFNSEGFIEMLEFLKQFPEEVDSAVYTDNYWEHYDSLWREGKVVAQLYTVSNFRDFNYVAKGSFGEPVTMIGFPSSNEDGSAIVASLQLAMSSKSTNKEGAWEFLRYFLTDEYQDEINYGFPLSIKRLDALAQEAVKKSTYIDENGNEVETDDYYYMDGVELIIEPMTEEEAERFKENLYSFTQIYNYDENLIQIIQEETAAYFNGQKNVGDVAGIIQSRAQIYVNENR